MGNLRKSWATGLPFLALIALGLAGCWGSPTANLDQEVVTQQGEVLSLDGSTAMPGPSLVELARNVLVAWNLR